MSRTVHPPEWPDKIMFAAMLCIIAGALGAAFAFLRLVGLRIDSDVSDLLYIMPAAASLVLSLATMALGIHGVRHQAAIWVTLAIVSGVLSMGMLGLTPLLCLIAVWFLVRSHAEGEETDHDERILHASLWPDKALAASMLLFVGGIVSLFQAFLLFVDDFNMPRELDGILPFFAGGCFVAGIWSLYASFEVYRLRRAWTGYLAAALNVLTIAFFVAGPALALAAFVFLQKARGEDEFEGAATPA